MHGEEEEKVRKLRQVFTELYLWWTAAHGSGRGHVDMELVIGKLYTSNRWMMVMNCVEMVMICRWIAAMWGERCLCAWWALLFVSIMDSSWYGARLNSCSCGLIISCFERDVMLKSNEWGYAQNERMREKGITLQTVESFCKGGGSFSSVSLPVDRYGVEIRLVQGS